MKLQTLVMAIILVGLLCVASALWSCGASLVPSETGDTAVASGGGITVHTLLKAYPPDAKEITLLIDNATGGQIAFGIDWRLEVKQGETWYEIPFKKDTLWPELAQTVADGETGSLTLNLSLLDYKLTEGEYRVVKDINGITYAAEFIVDKNAYSEEEATVI